MANDLGMTVKVDGVDALRRAIDDFSKSSQARISRPAIREASTPVIRAVRQNAPKKRDPRTGQLRKSITRRLKTYRGTGVVVAIVGPRRKFYTTDKYGRKVNPTNYAHLVEFGTAAHRVGNRSHAGSKAKPFMRPGWESSKQQAMSIMRRRMWIEIEKEGRRVAAKAAKQFRSDTARSFKRALRGNY